MRLLHIDSSIAGAGSVTRELSALIVTRLVGDVQHQITYRDVVEENLPHFTAVTAPSAHPLSKTVPVLDLTQQAQRANSDAILNEFLEADIVVVGVPMYNFTLPSELKAWLDRIVVPGTTFRYDKNGIEGLATGKRVILAIARGGFYGAESAFFAAEHAESFLRVAFGFIGVTHLDVVLAEGLNTGDDTKAKALTSARNAIDQLAA